MTDNDVNRPTINTEARLTRRDYLSLRALMSGWASWLTASEAVSSVAIEHPEWDMDEERTLAEWERGQVDD